MNRQAESVAGDRLSEVITAAAVLHEDGGLPLAEVAARDRRLAANGHGPGAWLDAVCALDKEKARLRQGLDRAEAGVAWFLGVLGLFFGWGAALGIFFFDGSGRVNAIGVVGLLVLVPGLFFMGFILAALPVGWTSRIPGVGALAALARGMSPGQLGGFLARWLPQTPREAWAAYRATVARHEYLFRNVHKWLVLRASQGFALGFQMGALLAALVLVIFTDLAFGWSTTLTSGDSARDAAVLHEVAGGLALPWSWSGSWAVPSRELVADSRYFRAATEKLSEVEAAQLGGWWPFLLMLLLFYGVLPRLGSVILSQFLLRRACRLTFDSLPGMRAVKARMQRARVRTTAAPPEAEPEAQVSGKADTGEARPGGLDEPVGAVIRWSGAPGSTVAIQDAFGELPVLEAGGANTLEADREAAAELAERIEDGQGVAVLVKAWEPPLMEMTDYLRELRGVLPDGRPILVFPLGAGKDTELRPGADRHADIWKHYLNTSEDPWIRIGRLREGSES